MYPICDSIFEISATQLRFLTEIPLKSPFLCVNRSPMAYGFSAGARAIRYTVNVAFKKGKSFPQGEIKLSVIMRCPFKAGVREAGSTAKRFHKDSYTWQYIIIFSPLDDNGSSFNFQ